MQHITPDSLMALAVATMSICTVLIGLRLLGRRLQRLSLGKDDVFITISWLLFVAMCINMIIAIAYGVWGIPILPIVRGQQGPEVSPRLARSLRFFWVHELILPIQLMFAKLSIIFFYRRLLCPNRGGPLHWTTLITAALVTAWGVAMFFAYLFQCGAPPSNYWSSSIETQEACSVRSNPIEGSMTISDSLFDVVILVLPIHRLITLQISPRQKILLIFVFTTGILSVVGSAIRLYIYSWPYDPSKASLLKNTNENIFVGIATFWGIFEAAFAIIAACLPSMKFFLDLTKAAFAGQKGPRDYDEDSESPSSNKQSRIGTPKLRGKANLAVDCEE